MSRLIITRSDMARLAGVSPTTVTRAIKHQGRLQNCLDGEGINIMHSEAQEYIFDKTGEMPDLSQFKNASGVQALKQSMKSGDYDGPSPDALEALPKDIRMLAYKPLIELVLTFGTDTRFLDWLNASKRIEDVQAMRIKNAAAVGDLVSRKAIQKDVLAPISAAHQKILTDGAKTLSQRLVPKIKSGATPEEVELLIRDTIEKFLKPMKSSIKRGLDAL